MPEEAISNAVDAIHGRAISSASVWPRRFAQELCELYQVPTAQPCSSGWSALVLALQAADIGTGDTVIVPAMTMVAVSNAVRFVGARPLFVDNADSYNPSASEVASAMDAAAAVRASSCATPTACRARTSTPSPRWRAGGACC